MNKKEIKSYWPQSFEHYMYPFSREKCQNTNKLKFNSVIKIIDKKGYFTQILYSFLC